MTEASTLTGRRYQHAITQMTGEPDLVGRIETEAVAARNAEIAVAVRGRQELICSCRFPDCPRVAAVLAIIEKPPRVGCITFPSPDMSLMDTLTEGCEPNRVVRLRNA